MIAIFIGWIQSLLSATVSVLITNDWESLMPDHRMVSRAWCFAALSLPFTEDSPRDYRIAKSVVPGRHTAIDDLLEIIVIIS